MKAVIPYTTLRINKDHDSRLFEDHIISEEALEIYIKTKENSKGKEPYMLTMRTPGEDFQLAIGVLFTNGIVISINDIISHKFLQADMNLTQILIHINHYPDVKNKKLFTHSSCGICNSETLEDVLFHSNFPIQDKSFSIYPAIIHNAFQCFDSNLDHFSLTGGNHKVCLIDEQSSLVYSAEDVGRHNALDKLIGKAILDEKLPLTKTVVVLSGRCSFEMTQKSWMAGIPIIACLGAPTSKAIELAENVGITLIGFVKERSFNIYTHKYRIIVED